MPIHDWTRVSAGTFHDFHQTWLVEIKRALNAGLLPPGYYALAEQYAGGFGPDVLTLEATDPKEPVSGFSDGREGRTAVAVAERPPKVRLHAKPDLEFYTRKASAVAIRHSSNHKVVAMIEIVSPGNKSSRHALSKFVAKAFEVLDAGVHLLIIDLLPPGTFDPQGIHGVIWQERTNEPFEPPPGQPLTLAAYIGGGDFEAYIEPTRVGAPLIEMPLFLEPDAYVPAPLEATYQSAWEAVPAIWRRVLEGAGTGK